MTTQTTEERAARGAGIVSPPAPGIAGTVKLAYWWRPKATNLLGVLYSVILVTGMPAPQALVLFLPALVTILGIGSLGHLINDCYDVDADARVGKPNRLAAMPRKTRRAVVAALGAAALLPWLVLPRDVLSGALLLAEFGLLLAYAMPPVRLKDRRVWAVVADGGYAYAIPAALAAHTFFLAAGSYGPAAFLVPLFLYQLALGVRHFLNHLAQDRTNDLATGTATLATEKGNRYIHVFIRRAILPLELATFLAYLIQLNRAAPFLPLFVSCIFFLSSSLQIVLTLGRSYSLLPYRFSRSHVDRLYQDILPMVLLAFLVRTDFRFLPLPAAHALLFYAAARMWVSRALVPVFWGARLLVGPVVLLLRMFRPAEPEREDAGSVQPGGRRGSMPKRPDRPNIAVVNINKGKYTETFVQGPLHRLSYNVHYLHGGELPRFDADDRHFLSNWPSVQRAAHVLEMALGLQENHFLKNSIASYLQSRQIRLVLAHFGPVGAEMLPLARDVGIPLVVYFHAYDVFHKETLRLYGPAYALLFREAACILGASARVLKHLEQLGASREKLVHLPAFVDFDLFPYTDHGSAPPRFLAVGRFAETKSPHLTILAFHRVAQVIPDSELVMIGKSGGGELFEACLILARALGLENRIEFRGVVSHDEVAIEMRRARVFVQHSVTTPENGDMEGKPVAVMEAMASGLSIVATHHPGIDELVQDGTTGFLVPEYNVDAMAEAMIRLAQDDDLVRRVGRSASIAVRSDRLISRHVEILEQIIDTCIRSA